MIPQVVYESNSLPFFFTPRNTSLIVVGWIPCRSLNALFLPRAIFDRESVRIAHAYMGVSKIVVPPKSSILTGFFHYFHHPFLGYHRFWKHPHVVFVPPVNYFTTRSFGFSPWAPFQTNVNSFGNIRGFRFKK